MKNITVKVNITATSNKQNSQYKTDNPKKSVYLTPQTETDKQKLIDFGLVEYTPEDGGAPFFVVKSTDEIKCWLNEQIVEKIPASIEDLNFKFEEGKFLTVNIIRGQKAGNVFYRLNGIKFEDDTLMQHAYQPFEEECPF